MKNLAFAFKMSVLVYLISASDAKSDGSKCINYSPEGHFKNKNQPSVFFVVPAGRLGNQMLGYAVALQLKKILGVDAYVTRQCHKYLSTTFREKDLQVIPALEDKFCNFYSGMDFEPYLGTFRQLVANKEYHTGRLIWLYPPSGFPGQSEYSPPDPGFNDQFEKEYEKTMRETIRIKPKFVRKAKEILEDVQKTRQEKQGKPRAETFVAVHARRGDYVKFANEVLGLKPLNSDFYQWAIEKKRKEHGDKVAFIFVSDDMAWGREKLKSTNAAKNDIYFVGLGERDLGMNVSPREGGEENLTSYNSSVDFALIASCNATIGSRGTYTIWSTAYGRQAEKEKPLTEFDYYADMNMDGPYM